jgi:hypothetical protein
MEIVVDSSPAVAIKIYTPTPTETVIFTPTETITPTLVEIHISDSGCPPYTAQFSAGDESYIGMINPWSEYGFQFMEFATVGSYQGRELEIVSYYIGAKHAVFLQVFNCEDEKGYWYWEVIDEIVLPSLEDDEHIYVNCRHFGISDGHVVGIGPKPDGTLQSYLATKAWVVYPDRCRFEELPAEDVDDVFCYPLNS